MAQVHYLTLVRVWGSSDSRNIALSDLDGDHDIDVYVANKEQPNIVWMNNGDGTFVDSGQTLGTNASLGVALGDLDGDGDSDAFVINQDQGNTVWLNDGQGTFTNSGQSLDTADSRGLAMGDIDHDGDLGRIRGQCKRRR